MNEKTPRIVLSWHYHCDAARIRNVRFEDLRIEEGPRLISLRIGKAFWTRDEQRGHIEDVSFKNIQAQSDPLRGELKGFDRAQLGTAKITSDWWDSGL